MVIKLKKGDTYVEVDTELDYDEVDTIVKSNELMDNNDFDVKDMEDDS